MREKRGFARLASKNRSFSGTAALLEFDIACIRCTPHPIVRVKRIKYFLAAGGPKNSNVTTPRVFADFARELKLIERLSTERLRARAYIHPRAIHMCARALHCALHGSGLSLQSIGSIPELHTRIWRGFQMTVGKAGFSRFTPDFRACCGEM